MLISGVDINKYRGHLDVIHLGSVVVNKDPLKLGRVKCLIPDLFPIQGDADYDVDSLPWIAPLNASGAGGSPNSSSFAVPDINSVLAISFPYGDIYFPFYIGYFQSSVTHQTAFDTDYPDTYGNIDSKGNLFKANKKTGEVSYTHNSGTVITIDKNGKIIVATATAGQDVVVDGISVKHHKHAFGGLNVPITGPAGTTAVAGLTDEPS